MATLYEDPASHGLHLVGMLEVRDQFDTIRRTVVFADSIFPETVFFATEDVPAREADSPFSWLQDKEHGRLWHVWDRTSFEPFKRAVNRGSFFWRYDRPDWREKRLRNERKRLLRKVARRIRVIEGFDEDLT